jgi:hypothetical protein
MLELEVRLQGLVKPPHQRRVKEPPPFVLVKRAAAA